MFGIIVNDPPLNTKDLKGGEDVTFGNTSLQVIHTPGHTHGSVCFYSPENKIVLTGDTMFAGSCGRTDLPEGDSAAMCSSLVDKIALLIPHDTRLYPGHGPDTTMVEELAHNPYLRKATWLRFNTEDF